MSLSTILSISSSIAWAKSSWSSDFIASLWLRTLWFVFVPATKEVEALQWQEDLILSVMIESSLLVARLYSSGSPLKWMVIVVFRVEMRQFGGCHCCEHVIIDDMVMIVGVVCGGVENPCNISGMVSGIP
eukprot:8239616-Ditylum_brightwellii.AAC.1